MMPNLVSEMAMWQQWAISDLLEEVTTKCQIITGAKVTEILEDGIAIEKDGKVEALTGYGSVIMACGARLVPTFEGKLDEFSEVYIIGDAKKVRKVIDATKEGTKIALEV